MTTLNTPAQDNTMNRKLYTMRTTKTETGYAFIVREFTETNEPQANGHYGITIIVKVGNGYRSRAIASAAGGKFKRHLERSRPTALGRGGFLA